MASTSALASKGITVAPSSELEPTWYGYIGNTADAMILLEATFDGTLNHLARRPHDKERSELIKSGNVFIHEAQTSGVKRWTDGITWSPSRMVGNFLVYRELNHPFAPGEKKRATAKDKRQNIQKKRNGASHSHVYSTTHGVLNKDQERSLVGSLVDSYDFKEDEICLIKKTITIKVRDLTHHIVSYYTIDDVLSGKLQTPRSDSRFHHIRPRKDIITSKSYKHPPDDLNGLQDDDDVRDNHSSFQSHGQGTFNFGNPNAPRLPAPSVNNMAYASNTYLPNNYTMGVGSAAYNLASYTGSMPVSSSAGHFNSPHSAAPNTISPYNSGVPAVAPHGSSSFTPYGQVPNMYGHVYRQQRPNSNPNMNTTPIMHRVSDYGQQSLGSGVPEIASGMSGLVQGQMASRSPHEAGGSGMPGMYQGQMNSRSLNENGYSSTAVYQARDNSSDSSHGYSQAQRTLSAPNPPYNPQVATQYTQHMETSPGNASAGHAHYMMNPPGNWPTQN